MPDILKIQEALTFVQQTPPETFRLMDITIQVTPTDFEHGKMVVLAEATDVGIVSDVNIFVMKSSTGVTLKIGSTTSPAITNVTHFSYQGSKTSFYVSNTTTEDIQVSFASAKV